MSYQDYFSAFEKITGRLIQNREDYASEGHDIRNTVHSHNSDQSKINRPSAKQHSSTQSSHCQHSGQEKNVSEKEDYGSASQVFKVHSDSPSLFSSSEMHHHKNSHPSRLSRSHCERPAPRMPSSSRLADTTGSRKPDPHGAESRECESGGLKSEEQLYSFPTSEKSKSTTGLKYYENRTAKTFQYEEERIGKRDHSVGRSKQQTKNKQVQVSKAYKLPDSDVMAGLAYNSKASKDSKERNDANKKLEICLSFNKCFEEDSSVEELVRTAFDFADCSSFEFSITKIRILPKENKTICHLDISNCSLKMAEECCDKMVTRMRQVSTQSISILHTHVKSTDAVPSDFKTQSHSEACTNKGKLRANQMERNFSKLSTDCPESVNGHGKQENLSNVPSVVNVNIQKSFKSPVLFKEFIMAAGENLDFAYKILHESISISSEASSCSLQTKTLADAKRLKNAFHNLQLQNRVKVSCYLKKTENSVSVQEALSDVKSRLEEILESHQEKIESVKKEINCMRREDLDLGRNVKTDKEKTLKDKLTELNMQRTEFKSHCDSLTRELRKADTATVTATTMDQLLKSVGIECNRLRSALPIYARRCEIIKQVTSNQVSIILGETGSGKSTQMAQYFYEANFAAHGTIVCTQPRRMAASTLAARVATEMAVHLGGLVGYKVGSAKKADEETKIMFTTDFGLLTECREDPELKKYSCIIVDEAHERSIYTEILLGMIKVCLQKRPELRLVITSATIDPEIFKRYFHTGPELRVSGRNFPVDVFYFEDAADDFEDYEKKAVAKVLEIHHTEEPGDVLVFLCSPVEIMRCCEEVDKRLLGKEDFKCRPLHGQLPSDEQRKVFERLPEGQRKIVFATNCAETSITIDGIRYVVDTGVSKEMKYDPNRNINQLGIFVISKSSADQRKGRAGRTASGKCYRLYSQEGFDGMNSINEPEILRVHLGQAVLKLAELDVNIESYDFVQAPSEIALKSAIYTLNYLGAIVNNKITHRGRWISILPFDPKLGYFVYEAEKANLLYDAIVLASVISTGSDLFYRGFSEMESQVVAESKTHFGSEYGDPFTWFNVFKSWSQVAQKEKSSWCRSRCVNYKSIRYAHQSIQDIVKSLSKELRRDVTLQFSTADCDIDKLRKILFKANASFLCNFSGVSKAGYFCLSLEHQVYIHPSSILKSLDLRPEWIVYNELIKTSKEFVKGITIVEEEWIHELVAHGKLNFDLSKAKRQKLSCVYHEEVGPSIFRAIVGPRFSNFQMLEEEMWNAGMPGSVLNATKDTCSIDIHSTHAMSSPFLEKLSQIKSSVVEGLTLEESEFNLNKGEGLGPSTIRVVLGCGGCVKNILMPNQSNKVIIKKKKCLTTEEDIRQKFRAFGEIKNIVQFKSSQAWGFVCYSKVAEAEAAVKGTSKDEFNVGELMLERQGKNERNMFDAKLTWLRRPITGRGTAFLKCSALDKPLLAGHSFLLQGRVCEIKISKKKDENLIIFNTGLATEEEIKDAVLKSLLQKGKADVKVEVSLARAKVPLIPGETDKKAEYISAFIRNYVDENSFQIQMRQPKEGSIYHVGFLKFTDLVKGYSVCQEISKNLFIDGRTIEVSPSLRTMLHVPKRIKMACQEHFNDIFKDASNKYKGTTLTWKNMKSDFSVEIKSPKPEYMVELRDLLNSVIDGEVIDCSDHRVHHRCLLKKAGQEHLKTIEGESGCLIITDSQREKIHLYGSNSNISKALKNIKIYLEEIKGSHQGLFYMKDENKPPGLMKKSMTLYGPYLDGLKDECKLTSVSINWKNHCVQFSGSDVAVNSAQQALAALADKVRNSSGKTRETSTPICSVCICPVDENEHLYRLEICGHAYCIECLQHQVSFAVNNKEFPLICARDGCNSYFVLRDLRFSLSKKWIDESKLTSMAVNAYVLANSEKLRFCSTANCPAVYEVTSKVSSCEFICPICSASICTSCHNAFHSGLTCDMAKNMTKADQKMLAWIAEDPTQRKRCPGCQWPIEKTEGCNKMHCTSCNTFFCWTCLATCLNEQDCYRHLQEAHGGFM